VVRANAKEWVFSPGSGWGGRGGLRALAVRLSCVAFLLVAAGCGRADLYRGLSERDANEFIVKLASAGVPSEKQIVPAERGDPTFTITVGKENLEKAFLVLEMYGLPRNKPKGIDEVYSGGGLIPGQFEEKAKYILALTGELEKTLRTISRVTDARVHVVLPEESVLRDSDEGAVRPTASVLIKFLPDAEGRKPYEDVDIKQLVARAIEGLNLNDVTVVSMPVQPVGSVNLSPEAGAAGAPGAAGKMTREQCLETYKDLCVDKAELRKLGPLIVHKDSYTQVLGALGGLAVLTLLFLVLWIVAFLQSMGLKKKLAIAAKVNKAKKPA
jgi:type III secretion protein J